MSYTIKGMNKFMKLSETIPREPEAWTCEDVSKWLKLIEMNQYVQNFKEMSIDGWLIFEIEEEDLVNDLKVSKKLHRKKIMKGIQILKDYKVYIRNHLTRKDMENETLYELRKEDEVEMENKEKLKSNLGFREEGALNQFNDQTRCHDVRNIEQSKFYKFFGGKVYLLI
jgi:hypothetical protein